MKRIIFPALAALSCAGAAFAAAPAIPEAGPLEFSVPKGEKFSLPNGLTVYLLEEHTIPAIRVSGLLRTGTIYDTAGKTGLAELVSSAVRLAGSAKYKADDANAQLEAMGASIETDIRKEYGEIGVFCLSKDAEKTLDILSDMLINPAFEPEKVKIAKDAMADDVKRRNDDANQLVWREAVRNFYGPNHPYGRRTELATLQAITGGDLVSFHKRYYKPNALTLAVAGDFSSSEMKRLLSEKFGKWEKRPLELEPVRAPEPAKTRKIFAVNKEVTNAPFMVLQTGPKRLDPDIYSLEVADHILGSPGMASRFFSEIRSRRGLAYGVYSFIRPFEKSGLIAGYCGTKNSSVSEAVEEMLRQIKLMKETPVTADELSGAKSAMVNSYIFKFARPIDSLRERMMSDYLGYPADHVDTYTKKISAVSTADVSAVSKRWYDPDSALVYVAGDVKQFLKPLSKLGEVKELAAD